MGELWDGITGFFGNILNYVKNREIAFWIDWYQKVKCVSALDKVWGWTPGHVQDNLGVVGFYDFRKAELTESGMLTIADVGGTVFGSLAGDLFRGFQKIAPAMETSMETSVKDSIVKGSPGITDAFKGKLGLLIDVILDMADPEKTKIPEATRQEIKNGLEPLLGMGITFTVGTALAELIHPTKEMGWGHVSHMLYDTVGMKALAEAYIEPLRLNLIKQPFKYNINELTTPFIPPWKDFVEWYGRGHVDEEEMTTAMKMHGIKPEWQYRYQRMGSKPSSYFMLNAIGKEGFWDPDDFRFWLSDAGYGAFQITEELLTPYEVAYGLKPPTTTQIDFLMMAYNNMNIRGAIGDRRAMKRTLFTAGMITRDEYEKILVEEKIAKEDMKEPLDLLEELETLKYRKEFQSSYEKKYLYGRLTKDELTAKLKEIGLKEAYITARVENLFTRKEGKIDAEEEGKVLTRAQVINAYKWGQKTKTWAALEVDNLGYSTDDALLLVESVDQKIVNDTKKEWQRAAEAKCLAWRMGLDELKTRLTGLGYDELWAEARVAYIKERRLGKEEVEEEEEVEEVEE
uniref:Uncharacterized protein n=1 Tax=viral metagenome TaxID=1070528 RepID=A0A6M3IHZ5_9ZZZZ